MNYLTATGAALPDNCDTAGVQSPVAASYSRENLSREKSLQPDLAADSGAGKCRRRTAGNSACRGTEPQKLVLDLPKGE
jgi:hypothetical protein